jgi:hypothetical protein
MKSGTGTDAAPSAAINGFSSQGDLLLNMERWSEGKWTTYISGSSGNSVNWYPQPSNGSTVTSAQMKWLNSAGVERFAMHTGTGDFTLGGNLVANTVGKTLRVTAGTNAMAGTVVLTAGAGTIASTAIDANTVIMLSIQSKSGTITAQPWVNTITPGTGCTIAGSATDNSTYNWVAIKVVQ